MTTLSDLLEATRRRARDYPSRDTLSGALAAGATAITFTTGTDVAAQAEIEIDLEVMRVLTKSTNTAGTVARGQSGTTDAAHANGAEVITAYRHSRFAYRHAINRALDAISLGVGKPTWDETQVFTSTKRLVQVPAAAREVFAVQSKPSGVTQLDPIPFRFRRSVPSSVVSTGKAVELTSWNPASGTAYIGYYGLWTVLAALTDVLDTEYPADGLDLIEGGALAFLADGEAFERVAFAEPHGVAELIATASDVRMEARELLSRFITRRSELGARYREQNWSWVR